MKTKIFVSLLLIFFFSLNTNAQTNNLSKLKNKIQDSSSVSAQTQNLGEDKNNLIQEKNQTLQQIREEMKTKVQEKRLAAIEKSQQKRAEYNIKLQSIQDQQKQNIVMRIDNRISTFNQAHTEKLADALDKLQSILDRIEQKTEVAKTDGLNTASVSAAISKAKTALTTAKTAITTQASKEYIINISSDEAKLKAQVGITVSQFRSDMQSVHKKVIDAKQAVQKAGSALAQLTNRSGINKPLDGDINATNGAAIITPSVKISTDAGSVLPTISSQ